MTSLCRNHLCFVLVCITTLFVPQSHGEESSDAIFLNWFNKHGGDANGIGLDVFPGMGRGVVANHKISKGDVILSVPMETVIHRETILAHYQNFDPRIANALETLSDDRTLLSSFLVIEKLRGNASQWYEYISMLPDSIINFQDLNQGELSSTEDPWLMRYVQHLRKENVQSEQNLSETFLPIVGLFKFSPTEMEELLSQTQLHWGASVVDSRALTIEGRKYLVPFADMFNYAPHPEWRAEAHGLAFLDTHIIGNGTFTIKADRDTEVGSQVFEDYGDNVNGIYGSHHGFVPLNNPFECVKLYAPPPHKVKKDSLDASGNKKYSQNLTKVLQTFGMSQRTLEGCIRIDKKSGSAIKGVEDLLSYLEFIVMDPTDIEKCTELINEADARNEQLSVEEVQQCRSPAGLELKEKAFAQLISMIEAKLTNSKQSVSEDETMLKLQSKDIANFGEKPALALRYRLGQKRILNEAIAVAKQKLKAFESMKLLKPSEDPREMTLQAKVERLNAFVRSFNPPKMDVEAAVMPPFRIGARVTKNIAAEDVYLSLPAEAILDVTTCGSSAINPTLEEVNRAIGRPDYFHHLLVCLMWERFVEGTKSKWWPYIGLLPSVGEMEAPNYYRKEVMEELKGSVVYHTAIQNRNHILKRFPNVQRFVFERYEPFKLHSYAFTARNYLWAHTILDSRAIWWNSQRHLVPLLDMVNCKQGPNKERVHSTALDASNYAVTKADKDYVVGEQIFENYGQPNHVYFLYHGFSLDNDQNIHDCVLIPMDLFTDKRAKQGDGAICVHYPLQSPRNTKVWEVLGSLLETTSHQEHLDIIMKAAESHLKAYPTSLKQDQELLAKAEAEHSTGPNHLASAIRFRIHEKVGLERILGSAAEKDEL